jgi:hypothetical protein
MDTTSAISLLSRSKQYLARVVRNDSTRKGLAAAGAGVIISCILEAVWGSPQAS